MDRDMEWFWACWIFLLPLVIAVAVVISDAENYHNPQTPLPASPSVWR